MKRRLTIWRCETRCNDAGERSINSVHSKIRLHDECCMTMARCLSAPIRCCRPQSVCFQVNSKSQIFRKPPGVRRLPSTAQRSSCNQRVREILATHGWFQTVLSDLPHFTFLGLNEDELPGRGLKRIEVHTQVFWIPDVG